MAIRITSDSTCDLGVLVEQRNIGILPLQVNLDAKSYYDGVDITPQDIFDFVAETKHKPVWDEPYRHTQVSKHDHNSSHNHQAVLQGTVKQALIHYFANPFPSARF